MRTVRIAAHVHSEWSYDAEWSLWDIADSFRRRGYDVVLMAEHDRGWDACRWSEYQCACAELSSDELLLVPGIEYEDEDNVVHVPVWGDDIPFLGAARPTLETLSAAADCGAASLLAHPLRRQAIARFRPSWARLLSAVEIWNRKSDGIAPCQAARSLADRQGLPPFVSLDFHSARQFFPLAMSATLDSDLSTGSIVEVVRAGACRPEFLGRSAIPFTAGAQGASLQALEDLRRRVRRPVRRLTHLVG